jgi:hypothetical protein
MALTEWAAAKLVTKGTREIRNGQLYARGFSRVVARESSRVEAWDSSRVVAWDSSTTSSWGTGVTVDIKSPCAARVHRNSYTSVPVCTVGPQTCPPKEASDAEA